MSWSYQRDESRSFTPIPVGAHRIRIVEAEKEISQTGNDMLRLKFEVSGQKGYLWHYIVFLPDRPEITNRNLTQFFDSFKDIADGDFNTTNWKGMVGACQVKHEDYNGSPSAKVQYFIHADKQGTLPPWIEPERDGNAATPTTDGDGFADAMADDVPFFGDKPQTEGTENAEQQKPF